MKGILYGAGVGPGDPELMTLKTVRLIRENEIIALPGAIATETVAYQIAVQAVPELACKTLIPVAMPMTHDREEMERNHDRAADTLEACLKNGQNVVFLTLGDPTIYYSVEGCNVYFEMRKDGQPVNPMDYLVE